MERSVACVLPHLFPGWTSGEENERSSGMEAWIQRHDCSAMPVQEPTFEQCLHLLRTHDWEKELSSYEHALDEGRDRCPPALQLTDGNRVLQLMPMRGDRTHYSYSCDHPLRILAFFGASRTFNAWNIGDEHRKSLVEMHFEGRQEELVEALSCLTSQMG